MFDSIGVMRRRQDREAHAVGRSIVVALMVAGCSSVPDAVNPVEWYKGTVGAISGNDHQEVASPRRPDGTFPDVNKTPDSEPRTPGKGLVGDRDNSNYAAPIRREPTPTKPLVKRTPAATQPQVSAVPEAKAAPQASPVPEAKPGPRMDSQPAPDAASPDKHSYQPSLDRRMQSARDEGPAAPPAVAAGGPPARPDIPAVVPAPGAQQPGKRNALNESYRRRLDESASSVVKPEAPASRSAYASATSAPAYPAAGVAAPSFESAPQLTPPRGVAASSTRGAKGVVVPAAPTSSFQVAVVEFAGAERLTAEDRKAIQAVAKLYRQTGGVVRIVGSAPAQTLNGDQVSQMMAGLDASMRRANAVAKALTGMGVPARKVYVGAAPDAVDAGAQVFIDY
jgi:outer membrane protein OmpA-like peptidoglycan-associated protein